MRYFLLTLVFTSCLALKPSETIAPNDQLYIALKNPTHMDIDGVGNFYIVQSDRLLLKYDYSGKFVQTYDEQALGIITSISCNNALYTMIHFQDSRSIIFLDRNMSVLQTINYEKWTTDDITAAEIANDNNIWLYNNTKRRLQKYCIEGKLILESFDLYGLSQKSTYVQQVVEQNNFVYLRNVEGDIMILDNMGRYLKDFNNKVYSEISPSAGGVHAKLESTIGLNIFNDLKFREIAASPMPKDIAVFKANVYGTFDNGIVKLN